MNSQMKKYAIMAAVSILAVGLTRKYAQKNPDSFVGKLASNVGLV